MIEVLFTRNMMLVNPLVEIPEIEIPLYGRGSSDPITQLALNGSDLPSRPFVRYMLWSSGVKRDISTSLRHLEKISKNIRDRYEIKKSTLPELKTAQVEISGELALEVEYLSHIPELHEAVTIFNVLAQGNKKIEIPTWFRSGGRVALQSYLDASFPAVISKDALIFSNSKNSRLWGYASHAREAANIPTLLEDLGRLSLRTPVRPSKRPEFTTFPKIKRLIL